MTTDALGLVKSIFAPVSGLRTVYPLYLASLINKALRAACALQAGKPDGILADVGELETLGNSRYAIPATDFNGTKYRITVEVVS